MISCEEEKEARLVLHRVRIEYWVSGDGVAYLKLVQELSDTLLVAGEILGSSHDA